MEADEIESQTLSCDGLQQGGVVAAAGRLSVLTTLAGVIDGHVADIYPGRERTLSCKAQ